MSSVLKLHCVKLDIFGFKHTPAVSFSLLPKTKESIKYAMFLSQRRQLEVQISPENLKVTNMNKNG